MATKKHPAVGEMNLPQYGYRLRWGPQGLVVEAIDYHAKALGIPWSLLRELADAAEQAPDDAEGD